MKDDTTCVLIVAMNEYGSMTNKTSKKLKVKSKIDVMHIFQSGTKQVSIAFSKFPNI